jgi:hypothetical protein
MISAGSSRSAAVVKQRSLDEMRLLDPSGFGIPLHHFLGAERYVCGNLSLDLGHG